MKNKKMLSALLALSLMASTAVPAFATETEKAALTPADASATQAVSGNKGTTSVILNLEEGEKPEESIMVADIPVILPIIMDLQGNITVPTNAKIANKNTTPIRVTEIKATPASGWSVVDYGDTEFGEDDVDKKQLALALRGDELTSGGSFDLTENNWDIESEEALDLEMGAKLPRQTELQNMEIAKMSFSVRMIWELTLTQKNRALSGYTGDEAESLVIPRYVSGNGENGTYEDYTYTMKTIAGSSFENCTNLASVEIPDTVETIGARAFAGCTSLTSVTIPASVTTIGSQAFADCTALTSLTIPGSVTSIASDAFGGCSNLTTISVDAFENSIPGAGWGVASSCVKWAGYEDETNYTLNDIGLATKYFKVQQNNTSIFPGYNTSVYTVPEYFVADAADAKNCGLTAGRKYYIKRLGPSAFSWFQETTPEKKAPWYQSRLDKLCWDMPYVEWIDAKTFYPFGGAGCGYGLQHVSGLFTYSWTSGTYIMAKVNSKANSCGTGWQNGNARTTVNVCY